MIDQNKAGAASPIDAEMQDAPAAPAAPVELLDLDALYGVERPLTVRWQGRTYSLKRPEALGPREVVTLQKLHSRGAGLQDSGDDLNAEQIAELDRLLVEILAIVAADLDAQAMPFAVRLQTALWYVKQVAPASAITGEKKVMAAGA